MTLTRSFRSRILALSVFFLSCTSDDGPALGFGELEALDPPPGEGSVWPGLSTSGDRIVLSWQEPAENDAWNDVWAVRTATLSDEGWSAPHTVATSRPDARFFVNWADFAAVWPVGEGKLAAHWLVRGPEGGYDYGIRVSRSSDWGKTWSEPWTPHEDGTPTEHGFVSMFPQGEGGMGMVWLDGRETAGGAHGGSRGAMTLRYREVDRHGTPGPEVLLDESICDCCQTDGALTSAGPIVVYRDRTESEIRDIYVTRLVDGHWTPGVPVHDDGWHIPACPVNGPAIAAQDEAVAIAWFTGDDDQPKVKVAFSADAGETFGAPVRIDDGNPLGRVDVVVLGDGSALVAWLERTPESGEVRVRRVLPDGRSGAASLVTTTSSGRDSGFPRMIRDGHGRIVFAWTESGEAGSIRMARTTKALE